MGEAGHANVPGTSDTTASLLEETDPAKLQEGSTEMMNALQTAMTDISEGAALLDGAANG